MLNIFCMWMDVNLWGPEGGAASLNNSYFPKMPISNLWMVDIILTEKAILQIGLN